nr:MFS transporter [Candidatus Eremiobacteraeota bacterium]
RTPAEHPRLGAAERRYIEAGREEEAVGLARVKWVELLRHRQTWTFIVGKLMTDGVWWFYLFWLPKFLDARYGIKLGGIALPLIVIYVVADFGSVFGGWLSGALIGRGWSEPRARKTTLLVAAVLIVPTAITPMVTHLWAAVALVSVAAAAHQWWSANLFTLSSDMFPRRAIGSVVGLGGFAGAVGGVLFQRVTGAVLQANGSDYRPIFLFCGIAYVTALGIINLLAPRMEPVRLGDA